MGSLSVCRRGRAWEGTGERVETGIQNCPRGRLGGGQRDRGAALNPSELLILQSQRISQTMRSFRSPFTIPRFVGRAQKKKCGQFKKRKEIESKMSTWLGLDAEVGEMVRQCEHRHPRYCLRRCLGFLLKDQVDTGPFHLNKRKWTPGC